MTADFAQWTCLLGCRKCQSAMGWAAWKANRWSAAAASESRWSSRDRNTCHGCGWDNHFAYWQPIRSETAVVTGKGSRS